jgi:uncharacterized membrane protein YqaE (UPF0057 family)
MRKRLFFLLAALIISSSYSHSFATTFIVPASAANFALTFDPDPAKVKSAIAEFKNLSWHEKKMKLKEVKKQLREYKKEKKSGKEPNTDTLLLIIIAILLPPLAVYLHEGVINIKFWIDLLLCLTAAIFFPLYGLGIIYALIVVLKKD